MKKTLLALTLTSMFMVGAVHAEDQSATINISGSVVGTSGSSCTVTPDDATIQLASNIKDLPLQGTKVTEAMPLKLFIAGHVDSSTDSCVGKIALQIHGQADNADGDVLANLDTSQAAAKGIGVGVFDVHMAPLSINGPDITPDDSTVEIKLEMVKLNGQTPVAGNVHSTLTVDIVHI